MRISHLDELNSINLDQLDDTVGMALNNTSVGSCSISIRMAGRASSHKASLLVLFKKVSPELSLVRNFCESYHFGNSVGKLRKCSLNVTSVDFSKVSESLGICFFKDIRPDFVFAWGLGEQELVCSLVEGENIINNDNVLLDSIVELDAEGSTISPFLLVVNEDELVSSLLAAQDSNCREVIAVSQVTLLDVVAVNSVLKDGEG